MRQFWQTASWLRLQGLRRRFSTFKYTSSINIVISGARCAMMSHFWYMAGKTNKQMQQLNAKLCYDQYVIHSICHSVPTPPAVLVHSLHCTCQQAHIFKYTLFYHLLHVDNWILVPGWWNPMTNMLFIAGLLSCQLASYTLDTLSPFWILTEIFFSFPDMFTLIVIFAPTGTLHVTMRNYRSAALMLAWFSPSPTAQ